MAEIQKDSTGLHSSSALRAGGTVFVTGGTGFLGAYIIRNLVEKGVSVRALRRSAKVPFFIDRDILDKVAWVEGDVLDISALDDAMKGADAVIHSAAIVSFSKSNRRQMYQTNIQGTTNVVNMALENNVRRLIHISSVAALGRTAASEEVTEQKKWEDSKSNTHYALTKHNSELEVWRGFAEGLEGVILNPSTIIGFGDWHTSSCAIFKNVYNEFPWYTKGVNGFVGVEDVAEAAVQLLQSDIHNKRFIVNADNITFQQLFNMIAEGFGKRKPHREATHTMGEIAWRLEALKSFFNGQKPLLTKETARIAHSYTHFNNTALLQALPHFSYTPLATVVQNACNQYRVALQSGTLSV